MLQLWSDVESTGLDSNISGAFEIACLVFKDGIFQDQKVFYLNPLTETIQFSEEAYLVNGVSEETIRSYPPAESVIPEIVDWLTLNNRFVFAGYCTDFDYRHVKALFERYDYKMEHYFDGRIIDVHELVKKACEKGIIGYTPDRKLETMTKALGIPHDSAHTALSDIWATRKLYETIRAMERKMK